jgi:hypothetical protein
MFSSTELFPLDCDPTTAIWGKSMGFWTCKASVWERWSSGDIVVGAATYSYCGENILELVDERDKRRVIHVDAVWAALAICTHPRGAAEIGTRPTPTGMGWSPWQAVYTEV